MTAEATIVIRADRVNMFEKRHPWVFSGTIQTVQGDPADGDVVALRASDGTFLARGYWNSQSQIRVHILTWDENQPVDEAFWRSRLARAIAARPTPDDPDHKAYRLVNAESDSLPGLIVDRYGHYLIMQALTLGMDRRKTLIAGLLMDLLPDVRGIYERSDVDVRGKEGLGSSTGRLTGEEPPLFIELEEHNCRFLVDVRGGHKTGFYLDQSLNRKMLFEALTRYNMAGQTLLNCFSYTGGFTLAALRAGMGRVINIDASAEALTLARRNLALNDFAVSDADFVEGDVFQVLRQYREAGQQFDAIVLDPPKFAYNRNQIEGACRGYKDINLLAFQLIRPGGLLMTFSCSGLVDADLFQKVVFGALIDARREAQILERLTAGPDHPVALTFPEGFYLKGLLCRVW